MPLINSLSVLEIQRAKQEKRERERVVAVLKDSGSLVVLDHQKEFDPRIHAEFKPAPEVVESAVQEMEEKKLDVASVVESKPEVEDKKARFEELRKQKAWLKSALKEEYAALKAIYG